MKVVVIVPAFNEEKTIIRVLKNIESLQFEKKIIVVDDGSIDNTYSVVKNQFKDIIVLRHAINLGKGSALKTGCEAVKKIEADLIATIDADGQHQPNDLLKMIGIAESQNLDIVFGVRKINSNMPVIFRFGNNFINWLVKLLFKISVSDTQSGLKVFKSSIYDKIAWESSNYFVETEIVINVGKNKLKYKEMVIDTIYSDIYKGTTVFDGLKIIFNIIKQKIK